MNDYHQPRSYDSDSFITDAYSSGGGGAGGRDAYASPSGWGSREERPYSRGSGGLTALEDMEDPYSHRRAAYQPPDPRRSHYRTESYDAGMSHQAAPPTSSYHYPEPLYSSSLARPRSMGPPPPLVAGAPPAIYSLDHLATFSVSRAQRLLTAEDGLHRLRHMAATTGVWAMRVELRIDAREVVVREAATGKEIDSFPISLVSAPVLLSEPPDSRELYSSVVVFIVQPDAAAGRAPPELNLFHCIGGVNGQDVVDDIMAACTGKFPRRPAVNTKSPAPAYIPTPAPTAAYASAPAAASSAAAAAAAAAAAYNEPAGAQPSMAVPPVIVQLPLAVAQDASVVAQPPPPVAQAPAAGVPALPVAAPPPPPILSTEQQVAQLNHCFDDIERFVTSLQRAANTQKELDRVKAAGRSSQQDLEYFQERSNPPATKEFVGIFQKFKFAFNLLPGLELVLTDPGVGELCRMLFAPLSVVLGASRDAGGRPRLANSVASPLLTQATYTLLQRSLTDGDRALWASLDRTWTTPSEQWTGAPVAGYTPIFEHSAQPSGGGAASKPRPTSTALTNGSGPAAAGAEPAGGAGDAQQKFLKELKGRSCKVCVVQASRAKDAEKARELSVVSGEYLEVLQHDKNWWKVKNVRGEEGYAPKTILTPLHGF